MTGERSREGDLPDLAVAFPEAAAVLRQAAAPPRTTLATAESCTGGLLGAVLTAVAGSSTCYLGGVVAYSNRAKVAELGVSPRLLQEFGAVSPQVAVALAAGVRQRWRATFGVGITGVAGPGFSERKPAGLIFVGLAGPRRSVIRRLDDDRGRHLNRVAAVRAALAALMEEMTYLMAGLTKDQQQGRERCYDDERLF